MIFTKNQVENLLNIIDFTTSLFITTQLGEESLSTFDKYILNKFGFDYKKIIQKYPPYLQSFMFGRLTAWLNDNQASQVAYKDFEKYLTSKQYTPLTKKEKTLYDISINRSYDHIKNLSNKRKDHLKQVISEEDVKREISESIKERTSIQNIVSNWGNKTGDWQRDYGRIAETEMNSIFQLGRATQIEEQYGVDQICYKDVYQGACFPTEDTEYLTSEGFKYLKDIVGHEKIYSFNLENEQGEWVNIVSKIEYDYKGEMHHYKTTTMDLMSTPNHKHLIGKHYIKNKKSCYSNSLMESSLVKDIPFRDIMYLSAKPITEGYNKETITICGKTIKTEIFAKFMGWWLSDGHISFRRAKIKQGGSQMSQIAITQVKEYNFESIREIFQNMFPDKNVLKINDKFVCNLDMSYDDLVHWFLKLGKATTKYIPYELKTLHPNYLILFLETFIKGDGNVSKKTNGKKNNIIGGSISCYTSSKKLADDLSEVIIKCGFSPAISIRDCIGKTSYKKNGKSVTTRHIRYIVRINKRNYVKNIKNHFNKIENWEGRVGCLELDKNFTLLIRRNGKFIFSGNCRHCINLYLTRGIGSQPRLFTLQELQANGTNIGKKVSDWLPVVGSTHPWCRCNLYFLPEGQKWNKEKGKFEYPEVYVQKIKRTQKNKITVGDKVFWV